MLKNLKFHIIAVSIICVAVVALYQWIGPRAAAPVQALGSNDRYVRVASASWGLNCNPNIAEARRAREVAGLEKDAQGRVIAQAPMKEMTIDNVLTSAKKLCDGKLSCDLLATSDILGLEPMDSCFKKLTLNYRCFELDRLKTTETNQGEILKIDCATPAASNAPAPEPTHP